MTPHSPIDPLSPPNEKTIVKLYAFMSIDKDGKNSIVAALTPMGWIPLVTSNERLIDRLKDMATKCAEQKKTRIGLFVFGRVDSGERRDVDTNQPIWECAP